ncbi:MAG: LuxR C-terminal-related transcriptional regulator [Aquabacterium sp.]
MTDSSASLTVDSDFDPANGAAAERLVRAIESSMAVQRRHQFFTWMQLHLRGLLPHDALTCGAYQAGRRDLAFETFHSSPMSAELLDLLGHGESRLLLALRDDWLAREGRCLHAPTAVLKERLRPSDWALLASAGIDDVLIHGISRPSRRSELESAFVLACTEHRHFRDEHRQYLELLLPNLHTTYRRVIAQEARLRSPRDTQQAGRAAARAVITDRERQILGSVRHGKSNIEISGLLDISPLTVKNHVQKILRKLGASNRAQAVAIAMGMGLLDADPGASSE